MSLVVLLLVCLVGVVVLALLVLIPVLVVHGHRQAEERRRTLAGYAHHKEWVYAAEDPGLIGRFRGPPFDRGTGHRATNVLTGRHDGRHFVAFDHHFRTGSGDSSQSHQYAVVALNLGVWAPDLAVGPTTTIRRWVDSLTGRDVAIGDAAFDQHFTVHSADPRFAVDVLRSDVREVMQHHPRTSWRISGDSILLVRPGAHSPGQIEAGLHLLDALLDRIPPAVWDNLRGHPPR